MELANRSIMTMQSYKPFNKLDAISAAPQWDTAETYYENAPVVYKGRYYRCITSPSATVGTWIDSEWTAVALAEEIDVKAPLASLPYAIVTKSISSNVVVADDRTVNFVDATSQTGTLTLLMPLVQTSGKSRDFYFAIKCGATPPTVTASYSPINAKGESADLTLTANATTVLHFTEVANGSTGVNPVFVVTGGANGGGSVDPATLNAKLNSTAIAPDWSNASVSYQVSQYITYNGNAYECMVAYTTDAQSPTPDNDIYNDTVTPATGHWKLTDMTTPDATLDITSQGSLRVVSAGGQTLWQQGYKLASASSATLSNEGVNRYDFTANATANVSLTLPIPPTDKVGDFVLDVTNPALDTASFTQSAFDSAQTYAVGDEVVYDSKIWRCVTAVSTAGAWTGTTNWEEAWPYFSIAGLSSTVEMVVPKGENLSEILSFAPGTRCELYFTLTSFAVNSHPTWKVVRQDVELYTGSAS